VICHWDEVETGRGEAGHIAGAWTDFGEGAGTKTVGLNRIRIDPGKWLDAGGGEHPWERESAVGEPELPEVGARPDSVANVDEVEGHANGQWKLLAKQAGAELTGLNWGLLHARSNKIYFRGLGLIARLDDLDFDDGEPQEPVSG